MPAELLICEIYQFKIFFISIFYFLYFKKNNKRCRFIVIGINIGLYIIHDDIIYIIKIMNYFHLNFFIFKVCR